MAKERASFRAQIQKLRAENAVLSLKIRQLSESNIRRSGDGSPAFKRRTPPPSSHSRRSINRRSRSRSPSIYGHFKTSSLSPGIKDNFNFLYNNIKFCYTKIVIIYKLISTDKNYRKFSGVISN